MAKGRLCGICHEVPTVNLVLCRKCGAAYDRHAKRETSILELIEWTAARARRFERARAEALLRIHGYAGAEGTR